MLPKAPAQGKGVGTLLYSATSPIGTTVFLILIKVAAAHPPPPPISNINNSYLLQTLYTAISCGFEIKETLPISIFLTVLRV